jgi:acetoacetate decarboxylase
MKEDEVRSRAFAMPLTNPAYPIGPYRFYHREFLIITYRTDPQKLRALVPEPLRVEEPLVKFEFIRMPDSTGFGDYTESGQVIPVSFNGRKGGYTHCMFLNDHPPIAGGRELWGFPKKLAEPTLKAEIDTLVGTLHYGPLRIAIGTMGYKHKQADLVAVKASLAAPNFLLKIMPHVDGKPRICELVEYHLTDIDLKGAWSGPGGAYAVLSRFGASGRVAGAGGCLRTPHRRGPYARAWEGRPRLPGLKPCCSIEGRLLCV